MVKATKKVLAFTVAATAIVGLASCVNGDVDKQSTEGVALEPLTYITATDNKTKDRTKVSPSPLQEAVEEPVEEEKPVQLWTDEELDAMALTLAGECYDDKEQDKRLVCEVILNRVSNEDFADSIIDVLSAPNQFNGYWSQSRTASANDYEVARQALEDWYANDCKPLSGYLLFEAGDNRENIFQTEF